MNKAQFIDEMQTRIRVLEDAEVEDILSEYAQHIDEKIAGGMSEEDAVAEFGDVNELVADILEAYHVKADFGAPSEAAKATAEAPTQKFEAADSSPAAKPAKHAAIEIAGLNKAVKNGAEAMGNAAKNGASALGKGAKAGARAVGTGAKAASSLSKRILIGCVRWCGILCLACVVAFVAVATIAAIIGLGFCLVMLVQGYPLAGVTLSLLGCSVAGAALTLLVAAPIRPIFRWRKEVAVNA